MSNEIKSSNYKVYVLYTEKDEAILKPSPSNVGVARTIWQHSDSWQRGSGKDNNRKQPQKRPKHPSLGPLPVGALPLCFTLSDSQDASRHQGEMSHMKSLSTIQSFRS